ncbi:hypothetical protein B0T17DRAFT_318447 [Bombardia bombarda]|uniref:Uncharacterized protein n=1 Tax=Bombardia bombarda TaxID=252184 RepID=A0AA39WMA7_9PEZI|nr:hypothetical protein B0T17DRAFT_318447 [Bombardia bombarda]
MFFRALYLFQPLRAHAQPWHLVNTCSTGFIYPYHHSRVRNRAQSVPQKSARAAGRGSIRKFTSGREVQSPFGPIAVSGLFELRLHFWCHERMRMVEETGVEPAGGTRTLGKERTQCVLRESYGLSVLGVRSR